MSYARGRVIERLRPWAGGRAPVETAASSRAVVIRPAREADAALLRDLAALDSASPLAGPTLMAVVDGRPWAAHALDDDRVIADPFTPSAEAVGLLRLRVRQLRAAQSRPARLRWRRRLPGRVRAS